ncbi:ABC transporter substrate-binding protein [Phytoactinopolyspora halotolerans]|uniref:ABC transporter substrate-binding protein n=2 Tax=Phytoactinopolyspora halotolerans TaxID=1981512 RepID=A0A6L9SCV8_9ACTN|nr:ABC transporter substrate-binding protein [Phytoactinopolyspora halotolerans]
MLAAACGSDDDSSDEDASTQEENGGADEGDAEGEDDSTDDGDGEEGGDLPALPELTEVNVGYVSAVDQMGVAIAQDLGFYDELNLDVTLADPFPTGVDALTALDAGDVDFVQVGTPSINAVLEGMDLVYLGNYSGSSSQLGIDETMAMVATAESEIDPDDLTTLAGKSVGVSIGSINHMYLLGLLEENGMSADDVEIVNTPPPEMAVAMETGSLDAAIAWDPWPITIRNDVDGVFEAVRGGGYIAYIGYIVSTREYAESNPETVEAFLTARAAADHWMRETPDEAAEVTTRWVPDTEIEVAEEAMQYNVIQLDPRFSACNYLALDTTIQLFNDMEAIDGTYDVNDHFMPGPILSVMERNPELFDDLPEIPQEAQITPDYTFVRGEAESACPQG